MAAGSGGACWTVGGTAFPAARKTVPHVALDLAPQQKPPAVLLVFHHLQAVQVSDQVGPLEVVPFPGQPRLQFQRSARRQERAEHVPRIVSRSLSEYSPSFDVSPC